MLPREAVNTSIAVFLVKYEYPASLEPCEYQGIPGKLAKRVCNHVLAIFTTDMETILCHVDENY